MKIARMEGRQLGTKGRWGWRLETVTIRRILMGDTISRIENHGQVTGEFSWYSFLCVQLANISFSF